MALIMRVALIKHEWYNINGFTLCGIWGHYTVTEQEALNLILRNGKRKCIYSDEYDRLLNELGISKYLDLRTFYKEQGSKDLREWLRNRGLYRNIEKDMREECKELAPEADVEAICTQIFENYPLIGEPILSDETLTKLFARAQFIFDDIAERGRTELSADERDIITIAIIQHIKRRNLQNDGKTDNQFWSYIYAQFGYRQGNKANTQRIYFALRAAIRSAFMQHDRFFSSEKDTQQYYTSLMLHALTPVQSMEGLFEILLFFYINDLEFNYVPEDPIFISLINCIATRWVKDIELQEGLNVRSNAIASGLKALFRERPRFMRVYCEHIVHQIDGIVRGVDVLKPESMLDCLLRQWYLKKEETLKEQISQKRSSGFGNVRAVSSSDSLRLRYVLENRKVCIFVPPIRLESKADVFPQIALYQGQTRIYMREMEVYGRLSWTTREALIRLDDTDLDYDKPLDIEASISYNGKLLLGRDQTLHRSYIVFGENGREVSAQSSASGVYYLFANASAHIDTGATNAEWIDNDGQLARLYIDEDSAVCVDGTELFLSKEQHEDIRYYPSVSRINGLRGRWKGETFNLYPEAFKLDLHLPEGRHSLNYHIIIDDKIEPLFRYCQDGRQAFVLDAPQTALKRHSIQIVELSSGRIVCNFGYAILPNAAYSLESGLIYDDGSPATIHVHYDGCDIISREYPVEGADWVVLSAGHLEYDLEAQLPLISGTLQGQNIFALPSAIWKENFSDMAFVNVHCPIGWNHRLYLGATDIPRNATNDSYELGNYIKTYKNREKADALILVIKNAQGEQDARTLTKIVFEEYFTESPVSIENGALMWNPEGRYFGGTRDEFQLTVDVPVEGSPFVYALNLKNGAVDRQFGRDCPCGEFPFSVSKKCKALFGAPADRVLFEGMLAIGAPEQRRVLGKYLYLTKARCWDENTGMIVNLEMPDTAGCLCNLQFQGNSIPSGEDFEYPEYIGELYFYNPSVQNWQYFNNQDNPEFELINPVRVWIVSEQWIILKTVEEEVPYIDRQYATIVNRRLNLPKKMQNYRLILPDYFEYRME